MGKLIAACLALALAAYAVIDIDLGDANDIVYEPVDQYNYVMAWPVATPAVEYSPTNLFTWGWDGAGAVVTGYVATNREVSIPPRFYGASVTGIGQYAFYANGNVRNLVIPDTVTYCGVGCCWYMYNTTNVVFGTGVSYLDNRAFSGIGLTSLVFRGMTAPALYEAAPWTVFDEGTTNNCTVYYPAGAAGFTDPWHGMPTRAY